MAWELSSYRSVEALMQAADYNLGVMLRSPLWQRWFAVNSEYVAAAAEARLAAGIAKLRSSSMLVGAGELVLTAGLPVAVWVGVFVAMGAPYAEARTLVRNESFLSGFSQGFVTGLLKWEWQQTVSRFFKFAPGQMNRFDESLGFIGANAHNEGLKAGFVHALSLNDNARKTILAKLRSLSPGTKANRWTRLDQIGYVIDLAAAGRRHRVFRAE